MRHTISRLTWIRALSLALSAACIAVGVAGCSYFTAHQDAIRQQNFTSLKARHGQLLEDWSELSDKTWSAAAVRGDCEAGNLKYREAFEYAAAGDDAHQLAQKAVTILREQFKSDCQLLLARTRKFTKVEADTLWAEVRKNYDYAVQGELNRVK